MKLFEATGKMQEGGDEDSATAKLLKERNTIANSMRSIGDVISEANEARFFSKINGVCWTVGSDSLVV